MINGFLIDIVNENNEDVTLSFFTNQKIPNGVSVTVKNLDFDYNSLLSMAINTGFIGNGICTDDNRIFQAAIYKNGTPIFYEFSKVLNDTEIMIDGLSNYFALTIPPSSKTLVQLLPCLPMPTESFTMTN